MSYNESKLTKLSQLKELAEKVKSDYATKAELKTVSDKVTEITEQGGEPNVLEGVKVNGTAVAIAQKIVDILIATGAADGTIKVQGADVAVAGLKALAFKADVSESELNAVLKAVIDAKAEQSAVTALQSAVDTLNGTGKGSVTKTVADEIAKIVADADESYDTLKEISDWISSHSSSASEMNSAIQTNTQNITKLTALVGTLPEETASSTVVEYIAEAIAKLSIGDYAKTTEVTETLKSYYTKTDIEGMVASDEEVEEMLGEVFAAAE